MEYTMEQKLLQMTHGELADLTLELYEALNWVLIDWLGTCRNYDVPKEDMATVADYLRKALAKAEEK